MDGSDDDLNNEQMKELQNQILQTISKFRKTFKISEQDYFGRPIDIPKKRITEVVKQKFVVINPTPGVNY